MITQNEEKMNQLRDKYSWFFNSKERTIQLLKTDEHFTDEEVLAYGSLFEMTNSTDKEVLVNVYEKFAALPDLISLQPISSHGRTANNAVVYYLKYDFSPSKKIPSGRYETIFSSDGTQEVVEQEDIPEMIISITSKAVTSNATLPLNDMLNAIIANLNLPDPEYIADFTIYERARIANEIFVEGKMGPGNRDVKFSMSSLEAHLIASIHPVGSFLGSGIILAPFSIDNDQVACYLESVNPTWTKLITTSKSYTGSVVIEEF
jgi:hypothetical protein